MLVLREKDCTEIVEVKGLNKIRCYVPVSVQVAKPLKKANRTI